MFKDHLEDSIHGDRFIQSNFWNDRGGLKTDLSKPGVIFCKTDYLAALLPEIQNSPHKFILVTHNSDHGPEKYWRPPNVVAWFGQNAILEEIIPIPIGLERPGIASSGDIQDFKSTASVVLKKKNLLYVNFSDGTNPTRPGIKIHLRRNRWATVEDKRINFREYLQKVKEHTFVMSPPGNGSDCHRTWEALYMGSFPVCENNYHNREFAKILPILLYDDPKKIDLEFLLKGLQEITGKLSKNAYTLGALRAQFWLDLINSYGAALGDVSSETTARE